ncbi:MAG: asparagine synthase-related protein [Pseudomonadota bacterium]
MGGILGRVEFGQSRVSKQSFLTSARKLSKYGDGSLQYDISDSIAVGCETFNLSQAQYSSDLDTEHPNLIVVADAVLDNRVDLAKHLDLPVETLPTTSNASLIRMAFLKWGERCPDYLDGDYAFACIDRSNHQVYLARDHIGARPLYWAKKQDTYLFSTSIEALIEFEEFRWKIDEKIVAEYLAFSIYPVSKPFFEDVHAVPAGSYVQADAHSKSIQRWWTPSTVPSRTKSIPAGIVEQCRNLLERAIAKRIATTKAVGTHFSGGIDSSGITLLASQLLKQNGMNLRSAYAWAPAVSEDYPLDRQTDERHRIQSLSKKFEFPVTFGTADAQNLLRFLDVPIEYDGVADLADEIPILNAAAADGIGVMLSGWGGDEAFSSHGNGYIGHLLARGKVPQVKRFARHRYGGLKRPSTLASLFWRELLHPALPPRLYYALHPNKVTQWDDEITAPELRRRFHRLFRDRKRFVRYGLNPNANLKRDLFAGHIPMRMETWASWSAQYGFQYRYPLTDRALLEFLLSLPPEQLYQEEQPRGLSKAALADCVPATASKKDIANEALRTDARTQAWTLLSEEVAAGRFDKDCPWINMKRFSELAQSPADQRAHLGVFTFASLFTAARIWKLYQRALEKGWVE